GPSLAALRSNPSPESLTVRRISFAVAHNSTSICLAPLYFAELFKASCNTRKKQRGTSGGRVLGTSRSLKLISNFCCWLNSTQKLLIAGTMPRYSSFDECNSCDKE